MRIIGLTGGIGSGKTEAAGIFAAQGVPVINADAIGHAVIAPGGAAAGRVLEAFGPDILSDGIIDRRKVGALVFSNSAARQRLNEIVHPAIFAEIMSQCAALEDQGRHAVVVEAALLAEHGVVEPFLDGLILITSQRANRVARLVASRGMTEAEAEQRIAAQTPPEQKAPLANWLIENDGDLDALRGRVEAIVRELGANNG